jgi:hypothetical protein
MYEHCLTVLARPFISFNCPESPRYYGTLTEVFWPQTAHLIFLHYRTECVGHAVTQLVEELRYKPEGRRFDSQWCHWKFSFT